MELSYFGLFSGVFPFIIPCFYQLDKRWPTTATAGGNAARTCDKASSYSLQQRPENSMPPQPQPQSISDTPRPLPPVTRATRRNLLDRAPVNPVRGRELRKPDSDRLRANQRSFRLTRQMAGSVSSRLRPGRLWSDEWPRAWPSWKQPLRYRWPCSWNCPVYDYERKKSLEPEKNKTPTNLSSCDNRNESRHNSTPFLSGDLQSPITSNVVKLFCNLEK